MTDYVSLEDLADFMDVPELLMDNATLALAAAQASVRGYLDQEITMVVDDVEEHDGNGSQRLRLLQRPVIEVTEVQENGDVLDEGDYALKTVGGSFRSILYRIDSCWPVGYGNIRVEYTHGWNARDDEDDFVWLVPADIKLVTLSAARRWYTSAGATDDSTLISETIGNYSYTRSSGATTVSGGAFDLVDAEKYVLDRYRF